MREFKNLSMNIQISTQLWLIFKIRNYRVFMYFKYLSGAVHTRVEVHRMDLEMSKLVEQPWLQLIYCTVCLPHGCNFR